MTSRNDIMEGFRSAGIYDGDIVVIQSSYKGLGGYESGPEGLVQTLIDMVGPDGTLIMPAYNLHSWTEGHYFDIMETPSGVGAVTEVFRLCTDVQRTRHPIHSLCVIGRHKEELCNMDYQVSFGPDSVFARLLELDAKYLTIGLGVKMPFLPCHYTESCMNVTCRRRKDFAGIYIGSDRNPSLATYSLDVRISAEKNPVYHAHELLCKRGRINISNYNGVDIYWDSATNYHQGFIDIIEEFPEAFF